MIPQTNQPAELTALPTGTEQVINALINDNGQVTARALHEFLQVETRFNDWAKRKIKTTNFVENIDYEAITQKRVTAQSNSYDEINYLLSLDMAKHLALMENNEQGRMFRNYFINAERKARELAGTVADQASHIINNRSYDIEARNVQVIQHNGYDVMTFKHDGRNYYVLADIKPVVGYAPTNTTAWDGIKTLMAMIPERGGRLVRVATHTQLTDKYRHGVKQKDQKRRLGQFLRSETKRNKAELEAPSQTALNLEDSQAPVMEQVQSVKQPDAPQATPNDVDKLLLLADHARKLGADDTYKQLINQAMNLV